MNFVLDTNAISETEKPRPNPRVIAAMVRSRGYRIVTRDATPFERMGCKILNLWK